MAHAVQHTQCPRCAKHGHDKSRDNLCVYSDGSKYCFRCGYYETGNGLSKIKDREYAVSPAITLPSDATDDLSNSARGYLRRYGLTDRDCALNTIMWSEYWQRLIFPYFDESGLVAWQGRYLGHDTKHGHGKWYSKGNLRDYMHYVGNRQSNKFVLVEDVVSAIKISHNLSVCAMPLFGSHISSTRLLQLKKKHGTILVYVWLDKDKAKESMQYAKIAREFNIEARSIITDLDPKEYTDEQIVEFLK